MRRCGRDSAERSCFDEKRSVIARIYASERLPRLLTAERRRLSVTLCADQPVDDLAGLRHRLFAGLLAAVGRSTSGQIFVSIS